MPVYVLHGFRWPRPLIRIHIILQNLDDAAAEWLVAPGTTQALLYNFDQLYPDCMEHLDTLRFVEQYDPTDTSSDATSQPYAYVADVVEEIKLGLDLDEIRQRGVGNDQWAAMMELRDKLAPEEKVAWYVVVCGDEERWAPPTLGDKVPESEEMADRTVGASQGNGSGPPAGAAPGKKASSPPGSRQSGEQKEPGRLKKLFGSARIGKRSSKASVRDIPTRSDSSHSTPSPGHEIQPPVLAAQPLTDPQHVPSQSPERPQEQQSSTGLSDSNDSNVDLPSIAEAPDTSEDALKTLRDQPNAAANNRVSQATFDSSARRPRSSGKTVDHRASWSTINYSALYDSNKHKGSLSNLQSGANPHTSLPHRSLNLDTRSLASLQQQQQYQNGVLNGSSPAQSPYPMTPIDGNSVVNGHGTVSPMASFEHSRNPVVRGSMNRSVSPVSEVGSYRGGGGARQRKSRAQSNLSTISDQTISPDDLVARNLDFVGTKLG